jgi:hypothetical protein
MKMKPVNTIIFLLTVTVFFNCSAQTNELTDNEKDSISHAIADSFKEFMNRPKYKVLTKDILDSIDDNNLEQTIIDNIYENIDEDYDHEFEIVSQMTAGQQAVFATWWVEAEVSNGGFNQFYFNSTGQFALMAEKGFRLFEATKFEQLMISANSIYAKEKDRLEKYDDDTMESFSESYEDNPLNKLDDQFYELQATEPFSQFRINYIKTHLTEFTQN